MAQLSLGEYRWRMIRRVIRKAKFKFEDTRNMGRRDDEHFKWLLKEGFFEDLGGGFYKLTERGKQSAELGQYEV